MDAPSSRYKVVEQGRRLVVIDTWNGDRPVTRQAPRSEAPTRPTTPRQASAALRPSRQPRAGNAGAGMADTVIATQSWFDAKGPRAVKLDAGAQALGLILLVVAGVAATVIILSWGWPALAVIGFFLAQKKVRAGLRAGVTAWLDTQQPG
jgi:hypothetical protein